MIEQFKFFLQTETYAGVGIHHKITDLLLSKSHQKVFVLVDEGVLKNPAYLAVHDSLRASSILVGVKSTRGSEEPDYDYLDQVASDLREHSIDCILAIGGGSCIDLAKAVAVLLTNPGKGIDYRGFDQVKLPGVPVMAVPTTAGTGSEITINAVFTNKNENKKLGINGRYLNATYAVLDPEFTVTAPKSVAISSGIDALVHTLESFVGVNANIMTRVFCKEAFRLLYHNLPAIVEDPENLAKRLNIQLGAYFAAISLFNSSSGIAGGISYPLGVYYHVPHGIAGGMFACPVVRYNIENGYYDYAELYDLLENADRSLAQEQKAWHFLEALESLCNKLNIPKTLLPFGIANEHYEHVISIMQPLQAAFDQNPVKLQVKDVNLLLDPFFA